ncbi:F-box/kelch-repeat protein [Spatholobus suberectus]|nr:F-box/kelch-repeat protein [Spatholobus suberectus]
MVIAAALPRNKRRRLAQHTLPAAVALPEDLIVEILSWIPVKALIRFRCVSKTWNSLISHPTFVKLHLQRSSKNAHILLPFMEDVNPEGDESVLCTRAAPCSIRRFLEDPPSTIDACCHRFDRLYFVFGSCNGLVCVHDFFAGDEFREHWVRFWNPATRITSGDSPRLRISSSNHEIGFGFGFDDWSGTYKAVIVVLDVKSRTLEVRVHCMGDTCWRNVLTCVAFPILGHSHAQFVSGALNWLALRSSLNSDYQWETVTVEQLAIFSYDLKKETHRTHFVVWLMTEFGDEKSWTQLLKVSYVCLQILPHIVVPLYMSDSGDVLMLVNDEDNYKFVLYDKRDNRIEHTGYPGDKILLPPYDYVQSLVMPY